MRKSVTIEDYLDTDDDIADFAALANANEKYPTTIEGCTSNMEKILDRKQFKSKLFWYAENICWIVTLHKRVLFKKLNRIYNGKRSRK